VFKRKYIRTNKSRKINRRRRKDMNDLNSLRADKKKVDEILEGVRTIKGYYDCQDCIKHKAESQALAKGISVATKLIEDEINFLELLYGELCIKYSNQHGEYEYKDIEDRIKYLKGLL
jgi:hypothetical protein